MGRVLIAGFTAALVLLATVLIYLVRGPRSRRDTVDVASLPAPAPRPARRALPPPSFGRETRAADSPRVHTATRLSGRVMGGDEAVVDRGDLVVEIVDESGARPTVTAAMSGRDFQARLPPGIYTVGARMRDLVGRVAGVRLNGREDVQILLVLQPAAVLSGRVLFEGELPQGVTVQAFVAGTRSLDAAVELVSGGAFELHVGPGVYDLEVEGHGVAPFRLNGVQAPAEGLELRLQRTATLRGAIGVPPGERCPLREVTLLRGEEELDVADVDLDQHCRFEVDGVPPGELLVRASGPGWLVEGRAYVPEHGEPAFVCLNPPCGDIPVARLELTLDPAARLADEDVVMLVRSDGVRDGQCRPVAGRCTFDDLVVGDQPTIYLVGVDCGQGEHLPALQPGLNQAIVPCRRLRQVEAFVRPRAEGMPPPAITVRCGSQSTATSHSFFVRTSCESSARALEYRLDLAPSWRSVALDGGDGPVLVELPVP